MNILNKKILAIIPARGGSKGIPLKNIYPLAGKPLLGWTVQAALASKLIDRVVVSSDNDDILQVATNFCAQPIKRPSEISGDDAPFNLLILQVLDYLENMGNYIPDILVYLQPTSPLRDNKDIDNALAMLDGETESVISVYEVDNKVLKSFLVNKNGFMQGVANNQFPFMNRQQLPSVYMPNGSIYVIKRATFLKTKNIFSEKTKPFVMSDKKSLDIDTLQDLKKAEEILKGGNLGK